MNKEFTVKEIAELLEVSKPTVQKTINDLKLDPSTIKSNKFRFYDFSTTITIIKAIKADFDVTILESDHETAKPQSETAKPQNNTEKPPSETAKPPNNTEKPPSETAKPPSSFEQDEIELLKNMVGVIQEQLKEKDKQLEVKDRQIQDLNNRLAEAMALTKGQQYIAAADKTTDLIEAQNRQQDPQEEQPADPIREEQAAAEPKKSFFKRLFNK